jgi:MFS family permease
MTQSATSICKEQGLNLDEIQMEEVHLDKILSKPPTGNVRRVLPQIASETRSRKSTSSISILNNEDPEDLEFPEGGVRAYLTVLGSFLGLIPAFGLPNSVGAIEAYISTHQLSDVSASTVSWIFSIFNFTAFFCSIFSGTVFDLTGTKIPMIVGTIAFCTGMLMTANAQTAWQFTLAFGVVVGFGCGTMMSPLVGVVSHYFSKKRATAISLATLGASVGGISIPLLLRKLYPTVGFVWAIRILTLVCFFFLICSTALMKERLKKEREPTKGWKEFFRVYILGLFDYKSFMELRFNFCALAIALAECSLMITAIYFPSYAIRRGFSENTAYLLVTVINCMGIVGRFVPSYISDKWLGPFNTCIITLVGCAVTTLAIWLPFGYSLEVLYVYAVLYGFFSGSILTISPVCCGKISRTEDFGKRYSTMYLVASFLMLVTIPIAGAIIGQGEIKRYNGFIIYAAMLELISALMHLCTRYVSVGWRICKF